MLLAARYAVCSSKMCANQPTLPAIGDRDVTLSEVKWSIAQALATLSARERCHAQIVGVHSVSRQSDNSYAVWFDLSPVDLEWNGMPGILCVYIDAHELDRTSGPDDLLAYMRGDCETRH
jgi:hypothetical protein